jgi:MFS family permease
MFQATRDIFALLAFAAGFIVRPFGAIVFGRLGDIVGRKYTFLVTILIMGLSTFIVGMLPNAATIGIAAPIILIGLRLLQGLALGGEYGGAATYVAEHSPPASAATTRRSFRPRPRSACSCRCS